MAKDLSKIYSKYYKYFKFTTYKTIEDLKHSRHKHFYNGEPQEVFPCKILEFTGNSYLRNAMMEDLKEISV